MANFIFDDVSVQIQKAQDDDGRIKVRLVAHSMMNDREDDILTKEAFDKAANNFLKRGVIDWFHKSRKGLTDDEKYSSIIGAPTEFKWEKQDGRDVPVFYGYITKSNEAVKRFVAPHLLANVPALQASIGGSVLESEETFDKNTGRKIRMIKTMDLDHIAIAPRNRVMSPGSLVSMVKAKTDKGVYGECACGDIVCYNSINEFMSDIKDHNNGRDSLISKALEVGYETDSSKMEGYDATRKQSLEGVNERGLSKRIGLKLRRGELKNDRNSINSFVESEVGKDKAVLFMKKFDKAIKDLMCKNNKG